MSEPMTLDLAADPRVTDAIARMQRIVPAATPAQLVRAAVLHMGEAVPEHEIEIYVREQMVLGGE